MWNLNGWLSIINFNLAIILIFTLCGTTSIFSYYSHSDCRLFYIAKTDLLHVLDKLTSFMWEPLSLGIPSTRSGFEAPGWIISRCISYSTPYTHPFSAFYTLPVNTLQLPLDFLQYLHILKLDGYRFERRTILFITTLFSEKLLPKISFAPNVSTIAAT